MAIKNKVKQLVRLVKPYQYSALRRYLEPRRFHAFCLGTNKSGTHSLANMFEDNYRASHENDYGSLIPRCLDWKSGVLTEAEFSEILESYNKFSWLELDSSHVHIEYIELLLKLYPEAKFILTIRDCYSWVDSCFNQLLNYKLSDSWRQLHDWRYGRIDPPYSLDQEKILLDKGLYPLENCFIAWAEHNRKALNCIPKDKLIVVRTFEINKKSQQLADFLDISVQTINTKRSHSFKAPQKHHLLSHISPEYIHEKAHRHCGDIMGQFFDDQDYLKNVISK